MDGQSLISAKEDSVLLNDRLSPRKDETRPKANTSNAFT
jgi:hypothetical protein